MAATRARQRRRSSDRGATVSSQFGGSVGLCIGTGGYHDCYFQVNLRSALTIRDAQSRLIVAGAVSHEFGMRPEQCCSALFLRHGLRIERLRVELQFARVQSRLQRNQAHATDFRTERNPEVGILRRGLSYCGQSEAKLVVATNHGVPSYRCQGRERTGRPSAVTIPVAQVDNTMWDWLTAVLSDEDRARWRLESLRQDDPTAFDLAGLDRQRQELERQQAKFVAVIERMEDAEAAGPIAAKLDSLGKQLSANARDREAVLARQAAWQRERDGMTDLLAACRRIAADMIRFTDWADRRAIAQTLRVRFELFPADHTPRWIATSEIVPDAVTSQSLYSGSGCTGGM
jgi:hypothetical protein